MVSRVSVCAPLWGALWMSLSACQSTPTLQRHNVDAAEAFAPVTMRIHPLTHIEGTTTPGGASASQVILHIELKDRYDDTVKGLGRLTVMLYRPVASGAAGDSAGGSTSSTDGPANERQDLKWSLPEFADPDPNMKRFDSATRTYRIRLDAPDWVLRTIRDERAGYIKLRVIFALAADSGEKVLTDDFIVQR